jgi:hypothetical protein
LHNRGAALYEPSDLQLIIMRKCYSSFTAKTLLLLPFHQAEVEGATDVRALLAAELKGENKLVQGQLDNGFRYVILPNKLPPARFEAHLEVHAGSVDELPDEQGIAHLVEHVTFLGSKKRENLLGTGARANAYTDFHHTVFHVHAPVTNTQTGARMLPQVCALGYNNSRKYRQLEMLSRMCVASLFFLAILQVGRWARSFGIFKIIPPCYWSQLLAQHGGW